MEEDDVSSFFHQDEDDTNSYNDQQEADTGVVSGLSLSSKTFETPDGIKYWIPICGDELKPKIGQIFGSIEDASQYYIKYARACGFDIRRSAEKKCKDGSTISKYFVCNRNGENKNTEYHEGMKRCMTFRCGCNAKIVVRACARNMFVIKKFVEEHNHELANDDAKHFMKVNRNMDVSQILFCYVASKLKMGAVRAHSFLKELYGGFSSVGSTAIDFKNINRDVRHYVGENDGEMIVRKFRNLKEVCSGFQFDYELEEDGSLCNLFWADPISIRNFELFGDAISIDAIFRSNKYQFKFVPFTGLDNHRKLVTFGAALIAKEDIESYTWAFKAFRSAMGREPIYVVTDQCPTMKPEIPSTFVNAKHRLCAWHIMRKFPNKINANAEHYGEVVNTVNRLVYNSEMSVDEFEAGWKSLFSKYDLDHIEWLKEIYENRQRWVTAFHGDVDMGGLLRTTSISESANSFFYNFYQKGDTIIEPYSRFESAVERQRNEQAKLNYDDRVSRPGMVTPKKIEAHASEVYTRAIFYDVQSEIKRSLYDVVVHSIELLSDEDIKMYVISDCDNDRKKFQVKHDTKIGDFECSCRLFRLRGIPCRHLFYALHQAKCDRIPSTFVVKRWMKNAESLASSDISKQVEIFRNMNDSTTSDASSIWLLFQNCLNLASCNPDKIAYLNKIMEETEEKLSVDAEISMKKRKSAVIESIIGPGIDEEIRIKNPQVQSFKGCRTRLKSSSEKTSTSKGKTTSKRRTCSICGLVEGHNTRSCSLNGKKND